MNPFALVRPVQLEPVPANLIRIYPNISEPAEVKELLSPLSGLLAIDLETCGTQAASPSTYIVGIGLASSTHILYLDWLTMSSSTKEYVLRWLTLPDLSLIAHNLFFDAAFLEAEAKRFGLELNFSWHTCTYATYRQLANEGFDGQSWGLKRAQVELLGWTESNERELDAWLVKAGYYKDIKLAAKEGYVQVGDRWMAPDKSQMFRAPADILGTYCGLDAASTYLLYTEVLLPAIDRLGTKEAKEEFVSYQKTFLHHVLAHVEQQLVGITIDEPQLKEHSLLLANNILVNTQDFLDHEKVVPYIREFNAAKVTEVESKEPAQLRKDGQVSKNWLNWRERVLLAKKTNHFNLNSGDHKRWLFYEKFGYPVELKTESGLPSMDSRALLAFGELGKFLTTIDEDSKELGYVEGCEKLLIDGRVHPQFRMPGTLTGRLSGSGGINIQQLPKSRGYLSCWIPRPGCVFVDCDESSLEQVVLAELSKDSSLWKLYGPAAKKNDVYLYNGAYTAGIGDRIRAAGYDPENPTAKGIAAAKKEAKHERGISKILTLGSSYGMGPNKLQMTLKLQGINISKDEAFSMWRSYWSLYSGVKDYERSLVEEWRWRGGWVFNGIGRPVAVAEPYIKDIVNRVVQSTGHDIHVKLVEILYKLLQDKGIPFRPIIIDLHDQCILECEESTAEEVRLTFSEAYSTLNREFLQGEIPIGGEAKIVKNLAEAKLDE